jgi:hypothetical protein
MMCDGKAELTATRNRNCLRHEKGSPNFHQQGRHIKVHILTTTEKVRSSFNNQNFSSSDQKHDCNKH